jgi:hypothetical protein
MTIRPQTGESLNFQIRLRPGDCDGRHGKDFGVVGRTDVLSHERDDRGRADETSPGEDYWKCRHLTKRPGDRAREFSEYVTLVGLFRVDRLGGRSLRDQPTT